MSAVTVLHSLPIMGVHSLLPAVAAFPSFPYGKTSLVDLWITGELLDKKTEKPTMKEVLDYTAKNVEIHIYRYARNLPAELKEEIRQEAAIRAAVAYPDLDTSRGWKSFIQLHARGATLDYLKGGNGFIEDGKVSDPDEDGIKYRVEVESGEENRLLNVDEVLGLNGVSVLQEAEKSILNPNWKRLNALCGKDIKLAVVCKVILGFSQEEIAEQYSRAYKSGVSRERISQVIYEVFNEIDNVMNTYSLKYNQYIYALGLSEYYHIKEHDNGYGEGWTEYDQNDPNSFVKSRPQEDLPNLDLDSRIIDPLNPDPVEVKAEKPPKEKVVVEYEDDIKKQTGFDLGYH